MHSEGGLGHHRLIFRNKPCTYEQDKLYHALSFENLADMFLFLFYFIFMFLFVY